MKKFLLASAGVFALTAVTSANAADLGARYTKAPPIIAAAYDWSGFYLGINGGGGWSHSCWDLISAGGTPIVPAGDGCHTASGGLVGGQIGYRWQAANWLFGVEAQGDWASFSGSSQSPAAWTIPLTNKTRTDAIGLFTAQMGYAWSNALWYVKGGAAVTHNKYTGLFTASGTVVDEASDTRWGGAVGTGIEFAFAPSWSVAVEYDHLFMAHRDIAFPATTNIIARTDTISQDIDMATVRVNYRFGGPARY